MFQYVMLATDGSAAAERAADFAAALATRYGARVTVLHTDWTKRWVTPGRW